MKMAGELWMREIRTPVRRGGAGNVRYRGAPARRGLRAVSRQPIPVVYEHIRIDTGFRADLVVEDKVIVEIKSAEPIAPVHKKQLPTYLRFADMRLGLLINSQVVLIRDGITRIVKGSKKTMITVE
jgi:GxxExxY protein